MATEIRIDAHEVVELGARFVDAEPVILGEMKTAMIRSTAQVQHDAQGVVTVDTGTLRRSITTDVTPLEGRVGSNLPYARPVEEGRRPGAPMPPSGALLGWMGRHGIPAEAEFLVRRAIARRGTRAQPYLVPALEKNRDAIGKEFDLAVRRAFTRLAARGA